MIFDLPMWDKFNSNLTKRNVVANATQKHKNKKDINLSVYYKRCQYCMIVVFMFNMKLSFKCFLLMCWEIELFNTSYMQNALCKSILVVRFSSFPPAKY